MEHYETIAKTVSALARCHQNEMAKRLAHAGIGMGQYFYVLAVCRNPGIGQDQLAQMMMINKSTVTRAVSLLEENGYLRREVNPEDGRALMLYPTGRAEEALPLIHLCLRESGALLTEGMEEGETAQLAGLLQKAFRNLLARPRPWCGGADGKSENQSAEPEQPDPSQDPAPSQEQSSHKEGM